MWKIGFMLIFVSIACHIQSQTGSSCYDPIDATIAGNRVFTGNQNSEQWFSYTAAQTGKVVLSSCDLTTEDTYVRVYPGGVCIPLILKAESDDHCSLQSKVAFIGTEGYDYLIVWTNKSSSTSFDWSVSEEEWQPGEICSQPLEAVEGSANVSDHLNATDQWFAYTPLSDGKITISSCGLTSENTSVRIYDDCAGIQLGGNDNLCNEQSEVEFNVSIGQSYLIQWEKKTILGSYNWSLAFDGISTVVANEEDYIFKIQNHSNCLRVNLPLEKESDTNIFNFSGMLVKYYKNNFKQFEIDCRDLTSGLYFVHVKVGLDIYTHKILIR